MKNVRVFIERGDDGTFSAYLPDDNGLDWGVSGEGISMEAAIDDFMAAYDEVKAYYKDNNKPFEEVKFKFSYDVPSLLNYYKNVLTLAGLGRITGINERQLSQYVSGYRHPSERTSHKIETALHNLGKELMSTRLL